MISIIRATKNDIASIVNIGSVSVTEAHKESCSAAILSEYIHKNYNYDAIQKELEDEGNIYHIIHYDDKPVGFSKIVLNAKYGNIQNEHVAKLDRIYLLKPYHGFKLGYELLKFNCAFSKNNNQTGIWLFTWVGNTRAIDFYTRMGFSIVGNHEFHVAQSHYNRNHHMFLDFSQMEGVSNNAITNQA